MATRINFQEPDKQYVTALEVTEEFDAVVGAVESARGSGKQFVVVTQATGDAEGKRVTVPAADVRSIQEV